ncbi:MAG: sugar phosphate isomerase/epimerase [Spirochaetales bacterium]|nr:MAG: sugar phosphate isomerase/epimerase [Spirochaetales bacterium]
MKIGCFALVDPFSALDHQLERIAGMGFKYADVTDNHPGGLLGRDFGFAATVSLDDNPMDVKRLFSKHGLTITSVCAHACLLDPVAPFRYGTHELMKAIRLAALMGVRYVVTTEGEPVTRWGEKLTFSESVFVITDRLYEPVRLAADLGVTILLEPHGPITDSIKGMEAILDSLGDPKGLSLNIDTGNSWLGGTDPVEFAKKFRQKIHHIHWKDLPEQFRKDRGKIFGCGFSPVALGEGVIDVEGVYKILKDVEYSTLEIGGDENLKKSVRYLEGLEKKYKSSQPSRN